MKAPLLVAKGTIALVAGLGLGYAVGISLAHDTQKGGALTMKAQISERSFVVKRLVKAGVAEVRNTGRR